EKRVFLVILFTSFSGSLVSRIPGAVQSAETLDSPLLLHHDDGAVGPRIYLSISIGMTNTICFHNKRQ
ncbi:hypothetical protein POW68_07075, partial [Escherichia coli]